ncbi:galactokinase [Treponema sp. R8-4-B8]
MIGSGFGGCTYTIIRRELVEEFKRRLEDYERIFGFRPVIYEVKLATRARVISEPVVETRRSIATTTGSRTVRKRVYANTADK